MIKIARKMAGTLAAMSFDTLRCRMLYAAGNRLRSSLFSLARCCSWSDRTNLRGARVCGA